MTRKVLHINDHTLEQVVARYLAELDNPAPDYRMRKVYRDWMREFVDEHAREDAAGFTEYREISA